MSFRQPALSLRMGKSQRFEDIDESLTSLALGLSSFSFPSSGSTDSTAATKGTILETSPDSSRLQDLSSNLHSLISSDADDVFSDVLFYISGGHVIPLHRCILVARCPFFKTLFAKSTTHLSSLAPTDEPTNIQSSKLRIDFGKLFDTMPVVGRVSYEAFMTTMGFVYSGKQNIPVVECIDDDQCTHEACGAVVEFAIEMLSLTSALGIGDLKDFWQKTLPKMLKKAHVDEVLPVLVAAKSHGADLLSSVCLCSVAISNLSSVDVEKQLPGALATDVLSLRQKLDMMPEEDSNSTHKRQCQRIRKALDSDDVELVHLLLQEGHVTLDEAHGLHYAVSYCKPHTVKDLIELELANLNTRDERRLTALHLASMRRDFSILVTLLTKGAHPRDLTPDGRTALQLCRQSLRKPNTSFNKKAVLSKKDSLCVRVLYQAGREDLSEGASAIFPPTADETELLSRLLYLENRVSMGRLIFPFETRLVSGVCNLDSTPEFIGFRCGEILRASGKKFEVDLNESPPSQTAIRISTASSPTRSPVLSEVLLRRLDALQRTVVLGRRMFPCHVPIMNSFIDDDESLELLSMQGGGSEEQKRKKRRYCELKEVLEGACQKGLAAIERRETTEQREPA